MHRSLAYILFISATIVLVSGQWIVNLGIRDCESAPYKIWSQKTTCKDMGGPYGYHQRIDCTATQATYYRCKSTDCSTACEAYKTVPLGICREDWNPPSEYFCFPDSQPDYSGWVGKNYIQQNIYVKDCQGEPYELALYPTNSCRPISTYIYTNWSCANGTTPVRYAYDSVAQNCNSKPVKETSYPEHECAPEANSQVETFCT